MHSCVCVASQNIVNNILESIWQISTKLTPVMHCGREVIALYFGVKAKGQVHSALKCAENGTLWVAYSTLCSAVV